MDLNNLMSNTGQSNNSRHHHSHSHSLNHGHHPIDPHNNPINHQLSPNQYNQSLMNSNIPINTINNLNTLNQYPMNSPNYQYLNSMNMTNQASSPYNITNPPNNLHLKTFSCDNFRKNSSHSLPMDRTPSVKLPGVKEILPGDFNHNQIEMQEYQIHKSMLQQRVHPPILKSSTSFANFRPVINESPASLMMNKNDSIDNFKRKRKNLPKATTDVLMNWLKENLDRPYPNAREKSYLCTQTGLTPQQLDNWFINARRRKVTLLKDMRDKHVTIAS
ncbi:homeobox domain-containing protein ASCRUDRAFT_77973 [Ascoidea rubescens DSM 1968]|uniref:Homeobox domain-containing protein n=1 Tax=Ascoidea rubescens DSM 1968 TaxID=1344418 RepID=A0A1D2V9A2_9ASCO|nr:hypothetical protein ASCRUDRAFT_77973 [Ascoidea rubescens DSM 1968]ODV58266.1 hypothetical protein ASCRUDRAFT_77973 [Ascoidea rubescens DSM 1968]